MPKFTEISAAEAIKALGAKLKDVTVQEAKLGTVKDKESGKEKPAMQTRDVPLRAEHILSAKKWDDGTVTIVTIDGQRYPADYKQPLAQTKEEAEAA